MQQKVKLTFTDGPDFDGTLRTFMAPHDQVAFERVYDVALSRFASEQRIEWSLWFLWRAWQRETGSPDDFETFLAKLQEYEAPDEDDANPPAGVLPG